MQNLYCAKPFYCVVSHIRPKLLSPCVLIAAECIGRKKGNEKQNKCSLEKPADTFPGQQLLSGRVILVHNGGSMEKTSLPDPTLSPTFLHVAQEFKLYGNLHINSF